MREDFAVVRPGAIERHGEYYSRATRGGQRSRLPTRELAPEIGLPRQAQRRALPALRSPFPEGRERDLD